jgi:DNA-directed RNA polymerase subunit RPC12/RpoP
MMRPNNPVEKQPEIQQLCPNCGAKLEVEKKYWCESCHRGYDEDELTKLYECSSCGTIFSPDDSYDGMSNRCPDCAKWGHIYMENICPDCLEEVELQEAEVAYCPDCDEYFTLGEVSTEQKPKPRKLKKGAKLIIEKPLTGIFGYTIDGDWVEVKSYDRDRDEYSVDIWCLEGGCHPTYVKVDELQQNTIPVNEEEFKAWLELSRKLGRKAPVRSSVEVEQNAHSP